MSNVPLTPRARRQRRMAQSHTPTGTNRRSQRRDDRTERLSMSPSGSYARRSLQIPRSPNAAAPRPVTPSNEHAMSIIDRMPSTPPSRTYSSNRSVVSESAAIPLDEDEMPDDEKHDVLHRRSQVQRRFSRLQQPFLPDTFDSKAPDRTRLEPQHLKRDGRRLNSLLNRAHRHDHLHDSSVGSHRRPPTHHVHNVDAADRGGGSGLSTHHISNPVQDDDVSSLGGVEDSALPALSLNRLSLAFKSRIDPGDLTAEEKGLWDLVQSQIERTRMDNQGRIRQLEKDLTDASEKLHETQSQKRLLEKELHSTSERIDNVKRDLQASKDVLSRQGEDSTKVRDLEEKLRDVEQKYRDVCTQLQDQQTEHDRAIRAIQRVLADVTTQRDTTVEQLQQDIATLKEEKEGLQTQVETLSSRKDVPASDQDVATLRSRAQRAFSLEREMETLKSTLLESETDRDNLKQHLERKGGKVVILEQELNVIRNSLNRSRDKEESLASTLDERKAEVEELKKQLKRIPAGGSNTDLTVSAKDGNQLNQNELENLREELREKQGSLETAKNIIASLENANGSLTADLRGKLKDKDEQVTSLKGEMAHGKRTLDHLATELRDLQLQKENLKSMSDQAKHTVRQQQALQKELESALSELRSAAAIHEAGGGHVDNSVVDQVSDVLGGLLGSLETSLSATKVLESPLVNVDSAESGSDIDAGGSDGFEASRHVVANNSVHEAASTDLRQQLDDQKAAVKHLENALRSQKLEMDKLRNETDDMQLFREEEEAKLKAEIRSLQDQCRTNMEVLTRKERELEVLRDSLEVTEAVGYISDDGSDSDDEDEGASMINRTMSIDSSHYSHSQAEAVATLLVQGGTGIEMTSNSSATKVNKLQMELRKANLDKEKVAKDLKHEQEALSNAKMIISSLERANKTMLEDLRSRLQDSNTAIASLLEKSSEQEKASSTLRTELDTLKEEKAKEVEEYKAEMSKLKDEQLVSALRLAAKEREVEELRKNMLKYEKEWPESLSVPTSESVEESKDTEDAMQSSETEAKGPPSP